MVGIIRSIFERIPAFDEIKRPAANSVTATSRFRSYKIPPREQNGIQSAARFCSFVYVIRQAVQFLRTGVSGENPGGNSVTYRIINLCLNDRYGCGKNNFESALTGHRIGDVVGRLKSKRRPASPTPCIRGTCRRAQFCGLKRIGRCNPLNRYVNINRHNV